MAGADWFARVVTAAWRRGGMAALAVVVVAIWPSVAQACGGFPVAMPVEGEDGSLSAEKPGLTAETAGGDEVPMGHRPCEGPFCSSDSSAPSSPPPTFGGEQQDHRVILGALLDELRPAAREGVAKSTSVHPIRVASSIYHPPR